MPRVLGQMGAWLPAVIRIVGKRKMIADAVAACGLPFTESAPSLRKRALQVNKLEMESTFNLTVSDANGVEVPVQVRDISLFLDANEHRLVQLLRLIPGCQFMVDLSWDFPVKSAGQYNCFPAALLSRLGTIGVDLVVSVYATSGNSG